MSIVWNALHICPICEEEIAESGKRLCHGCTLVQAYVRRVEPKQTTPPTWDFYDRGFCVGIGFLIISCLIAAWMVFGR